MLSPEMSSRRPRWLSEQDQPPKAPTIYDVAALASVSHQTVSRVINKTGHVRPVTRHRVLAAMSYLGYVKNEAAADLARKPHSGTSHADATSSHSTVGN
ncbi:MULTISPECIES: LacI family DNA-binding transcriptional regulator [unclassified Curtobacterium]|uniref:LacI family DNA-binding transcriptional regulator n=2 Tax=unclassified Curtobacterium TaxID=257496 RepID=UPI00288B2D5C|nr:MULTISPECIES: LacI family DNA-binding transcriptional regulator [unclassified Curtobacterium]